MRGIISTRHIRIAINSNLTKNIETMKRFFCIVCALAVNVLTFTTWADTPEVTIEDWQIGIVDDGDGTLGISNASTDPQFTEPIVSITQEGKVGIGTLYPQQYLHVVGGNILISKTSAKARADGSANGSILFGSNTNEEDGYRHGRWGIEYLDSDKDGYGLNFWKTWEPNVGTLNYALFLKNNGNIGIGTKNPAYKLDVIGTIRAREILVNLDGVGGADFVFDNNYRLRPLSEVQSFIQENRHLPEIQSAAEMQQNGVSVNELQFQLLQKIEELTLYIIEQDKQIQELQQKVEKWEK